MKNSAGIWVGYSSRETNGTWANLSTPTSGESTLTEIRDVSCTSSQFCMAAGWFDTHSGYKLLTEIWNGSSWSLQVRPEEYGYLYGVTCVSAEFCLAVGGDFYLPKAQAWNGTTWTGLSTAKLTGLSGGDFSAVSCVSTTDCVAVGDGSSELETHPAVTLGETWNGVAWTMQTTPRESERARNELTGVACVDLAACTAVGMTKAQGPPRSIVESRPTPYATSTFSSTFGSEGSGNGQLRRPIGMAIDASGNLWVADRENDRIEEFNSKGEYLSQFGTKGSGNGQLNEPQSLAFASNGDLWVTDAGNHRVEEFSPKGEYLAKFGSEGTAGGQFTEPYGIAIEPDGRIWVSDARYYRVEEFNPIGGFMREEHGTGQGGSGNGEFRHPVGLAIDANGDLWVSDSGNNRVQELSSSGEYLGQFGSSAGAGEGQFDEPYAIAVKPSGDLLVVDLGNNRLEEFTQGGEYVTQFGTKGSGNGQLNEPRGLAVGTGGAVYVTDSVNARVEKWFQPATPEVSTQAATGVKASEATLEGSVDPASLDTHYEFEYGTSETYGHKAPVPSTDAGAGMVNVAAKRAISGLTEGALYHYRVVASSAGGTSYGADRTFTTLKLPVATTEPASYVNTFEPQLNASVNPKGSDTHYQFEYGETESYGTKIPVTAEDVGSGASAVAVSKTLQGLKRNTNFHYRVVAESGAGTVHGTDQQFNTLPPCKGSEEKCTWALQSTVNPPPKTEDSLSDVACRSATSCIGIGYNQYREDSVV
ncbi:MAG: hypothetical protein WB507_09180, partial [Solirubrobacterales bacterium]